MQCWIVPCNIGTYDIDQAIRTNGSYCWWRQSNDFAVGDTVFVFITKPVQAIRYRMEVTAIGVPETEQLMPEQLWVDKSLYYESLGSNKLARFEMQEQYADDVFPLEMLWEHGLQVYPQSVRTISKELSDFLLHKDDSDKHYKASPDIDPAGNPDLGTDYAADDGLWEGAVDKALVNHYERDRKAREECILAHGCRCAICGFDFEEAYGAMGRHFIHVHHIVPISKIGKGYQVNPVTDLIPVCPNCHAMLHSKPGCHEAYTPEELRAMMHQHLRSEFTDTRQPIHIGKLSQLEDDEKILAFVSDRLEANGHDANDLSLIKDCLNEFGEFYPFMGITDWLRAIRDYVKRQKLSNGSMAAEP